jgi:hypothetical protein
MIIEIGKTDKPKRGTELASCGLSSFISFTEKEIESNLP